MTHGQTQTDRQTDVSAWKLFLLIPRLLLQPSSIGNQHRKKSNIKQCYQQFLCQEWKDLFISSNSKSYKRPTQDQAFKAALKLISCGEISRAARVLTSSGLADDTEETIQKLACKHPSRTNQLNLPDPIACTFSLSKFHLLSAIRKSPRGSGPGHSGWRYEHLKVLIDDPSTADLLFSVCSLIANGQLPVSVSKLLSAACLIALPKSNGDVRPVAIGESLRRLTAKVICIQNKEKIC